MLRPALEIRSGSRCDYNQRHLRKFGDQEGKSDTMPLPAAQTRRRQFRFDEGLNLLFDDRADEVIQYEEKIQKILQKGIKPDRLIGLRVTTRLDRILKETEGPDGNLVGESIRTTPIRDDSRPLLFPFLLLEAKSEKSSDGFSKIDSQSGFGLRNLLQLQRNLEHATIENRQSGMKPLVWYLAYRGEVWRLSGAYVEETNKDSEPNYRILQLWEGNINYEKHALQLLLIIDYIFDWARDVYRRDIISGLLSLATNASHSLVADTDVGSLHNDFPPFVDVDIDEPTIGNDIEQIEPFAVPHLLRFFDHENLAFRDARYMTYKVWALHVTLENLDQFLSKMDTTEKAKQLARQLWRSVRGQGTWSVTADCLNAVEKLWTGQDRESHTFQNPEQRFLASFAVDSYFTDGGNRGMVRLDLWNQVHTLTYVAIAQDALQALRERTKFNPRSLHLDIADCPMIPTECVVDLFKSVRFSSVRQCFAAAIARSRLSSGSRPRSQGDLYSFPACPTRHGLVRYFTPILTTPQYSGSASPAELLKRIYKLLKIGMAEPSESFLRVSQQSVKHETEVTCSRRMTRSRRTRKMLGKSNAVLVKGIGAETKDGEKHDLAWYCLFVFDTPSPSDNEITDPFEKLGVFRGTLRTFFNVRLRECNFRDTKCGGTEELRHSLEILEHVSTQYQLIQSMDTNIGPDNAPDWIQQKCKVLAYPSVKWPYTFSDTMDGIKQVSESYGFSQTLHYLIVAFQTILSPQNQLFEFRGELALLEERVRKDLPVDSSASIPLSTVQYYADPQLVTFIEDTEDDMERRASSSSDTDSSIEVIARPTNRKRRRDER
ncbi:uncharacterized protein Z519_07561 [Cladophialophora bantiana CBS 173.52]|uniref:Uncharacterized protein n=1 Tax=Cladophialophora bantiana (strain ATCC 10958 / CBS 173.52 / CDC B-1940 / NIH 8579) TaxID=1442370 RepID=A0A0D2I3Y0_CLAB1|nr:uncharacterized protein Z519_07561 [Cladophialophora bantiana CBS 173.52]KIW91594.1 hypothetical protein Z519_07561 [Cladophialophora bantiana CBS 173.52]